MRRKLSFVALAIAVSVVAAMASSAVASTITGTFGDGKPTILFNEDTGLWSIQTDGVPVGLFDILSDVPIFNSTPANFPPGALFVPIDNTTEKGWAALPSNAFTTDLNLGLVGLTGPSLTGPRLMPSQSYLNQHVTITWSHGFGSPNLNGDLITYSPGPEPTSAALVALAAMIFGMQRSRNRFA